MAYFREGEALGATLPDDFVQELLPLWVLAVVFTVVTAVSTCMAAARAARYAAAAVEAAYREDALKVHEAPLDCHDGAGTGIVRVRGGVAEASEADHEKVVGKRACGIDVRVTRATSATTWFSVDISVGPAAVMSGTSSGRGSGWLANAFRDGGVGDAAVLNGKLHDEAAMQREERLEFLGTSGFSAHHNMYREFIRHDGGLLYDILLALLLLTVAAFWTAVVQRHLLLYDARSSYRVYDASLSSTARWLLPTRLDPGNVTESASASLHAQVTNMGIDVPVAPGDPGRWLLPVDDSDWDDLNSVLLNAHTLVKLWTTYGMLQAIVIIGLISKYVCCCIGEPGGCSGSQGHERGARASRGSQGEPSRTTHVVFANAPYCGNSE